MMILEGVVTSLSPAGDWNIAPMGPQVNPELTEFCLRPYRTTHTYENLKYQPSGVLHITDDVGLIARAALGGNVGDVPLIPARTIPGRVIASACRYWEFEVASMDDSRERTEIRLKITHSETLREFWGFNRAKHAVLEATILATRLHLLPKEVVTRELERLAIPVEKTAGPAERDAFEFVCRVIENWPSPAM